MVVQWLGLWFAKHFSNMVKAHGSGMFWLHSFCSQDCNGTLTQSTPCPPFPGWICLARATFTAVNFKSQGCQNALWIACGRLVYRVYLSLVLQVICNRKIDKKFLIFWSLLEDWTTWSDCSVSCGIGAITRFAAMRKCFRMCLMNTSWFELNVLGGRVIAILSERWLCNVHSVQFNIMCYIYYTL